MVETRPTRIGPYVITDVLGEGGMGVVYRAKSEATSERVAIKTVKIAAESQLGGIRREIQALEKLAHPGVVRVLAHGVADGRPWYAMELLEGETLFDYSQRLWKGVVQAAPTARGTAGESPTVRGLSPLNLAAMHPHRDPARPDRERNRRVPVAGGQLVQALTLVRRTLTPLSFLHGEGIVHRDLKPQNIFLRDAEHPVLVDFGLAWGSAGAGGREVLDLPGDVVGTPEYMSPEQIRGELVDARSDLYAVGCLLYEVLTGQPPFLGNTDSKVLGKHLNEPPTPPSQFTSGTPRELDELVVALLQKEPRDRLGHAVDAIEILDSLGAVPEPQPTPRARVYVYRPALAGRDDSLETIRRAVENAKRTLGGVVLIAGESGIGKTYLALEAARRAGTASFQTVVGTCAPVGMQQAGPRGTPLHPFLPLLRSIADRCTSRGAAVADELLGRRGKVLAQLAPELAAVPGHDAYPPPPMLDGGAARDRLLRCLRDTLAAVARYKPVLLLLDDLQWADELTLLFLNTLPDTFFDDKNILILGTYRTEESTPELRTLQKRPYTEQIGLDRLDDSNVKSLVADMLAVNRMPAPFVAFLARHARGNPFFVAEYLRTAAAEGLVQRRSRELFVGSEDGVSSDSYESLSLPKTLRALVARRLDGLSEDAQRIADFACVVGRVLDPEVVEQAARMDADAAMSAINELLARHVLEQLPDGRLQFVHDKLCEIAYDDIEAAQRPAMHRAVGLALESHYTVRDSDSDTAAATDTAAGADSPGLARHYGVLGHHFRIAGMTHKAVDYTEKAGERAMNSSAYTEACALWRVLLELDDDGANVGARRRARWLRRLGEASFNIGDLDAAERHTCDAFSHLGRNVPRSRAGWVRVLGTQLATQTAHRFGLRKPTAQDSGAREDLLESATGAGTMAWRYFFADNVVGVITMSLWSVNEIETATPPIRAATPYAWLGYTAGTMRMHKLAQLYFDQAHADANAIDDANGSVFTDLMEGMYHSCFARWPLVEQCAQRGLDTLRDAGDPQNVERHTCLRANMYYYAGRFDESIALFDELLASARQRANVQHTAWGLYARALSLVAQGKLETAAGNLADATDMLATQTDVASQIICHGLRALTHLRRGELGDARRWADDASDKIAAVRGAAYSTISGHAAVCETYLELLERTPGRDATLAARAQQAVKAARRFALMFPFGAPMAQRYRGQLLAITGHHRRAQRAFDKSAQLAAEYDMPYDEAQAHYLAARYGHNSLRRSLQDGAHDRLSRAAVGFERLGCAYHRVRIAELKRR